MPYNGGAPVTIHAGGRSPSPVPSALPEDLAAVLAGIEVVVLVGIPGSGKTQFAEALVRGGGGGGQESASKAEPPAAGSHAAAAAADGPGNSAPAPLPAVVPDAATALPSTASATGGWQRVCQDEIGRKAAERAVRTRKRGQRMVLDRCSVELQERRKWLDSMRRQNPSVAILAVHFDTAIDVCVQRVKDRVGHPVAALAGVRVKGIIRGFARRLVPPAPEEGFVKVLTVTTLAAADELLAAFAEGDAANKAAAELLSAFVCPAPT